MRPRKTAGGLRSARWFAADDLRSFGHRSRMNQIGYAVEEFLGKPIIGIINTWSDFAQCHAHFKHRMEDVKRGVLQGGGGSRATSSRPTKAAISTSWRRASASRSVSRPSTSFAAAQSMPHKALLTCTTLGSVDFGAQSLAATGRAPACEGSRQQKDKNWQCAPKARIISGGGFHPDSCR
jgi:dihydroxyacid dehydratase/phosphogluconate dehydratase